MIQLLIFYAAVAILTLFNSTFGCANRGNRNLVNDKNVSKKKNATNPKKPKILQDIIPVEKNKPKRKCKRYATNKFHIRKNGSVKTLATGTSNYFLPSSLNSIPIKLREQRTLYGLSDTLAFGKIRRFQTVFKDEIEEEHKDSVFTIVSKDYVEERPPLVIVPKETAIIGDAGDNEVLAFLYKKRKIYGIDV
uniref:Uncharacterized protein n=1 Tax=Parastrongyloides trichosuri TaxID=131310 RepID=A0A0N4Z924_PARTI